MDSHEIIELIKERFACNKKQKKRILEALEDDEPQTALELLGSKLVLSL